VRLFASPRGWLPAGIPWDEPELVSLLDGARTSLRLQLLTYGTGGREPYPTLADALTRAARRGVRVRVLLSDWSKRPALMGAVKDLARTPGIEVRMITVPVYSTGFIDFARVAHAKYLVVDDGTAWVGTSNWERDYFYRSRNVALVVQGGRAVADAAEVFDSTWASPYTYAIDPAKTYEPPVISRQGR
jgi:phosphatidylserine/phosphatidylglycerophosphate/cardiolipin synthase-like enzyme